MDKKKLLDQVLGTLREGGAGGDAYLEERRSLQLVVRSGKLEEIYQSSVRGLAVRALSEGRLGFVHTSTVDPEGARRAAGKALDLARSATPRGELMIADPAGPGDGTDEGESLGIFDPSLRERSIEEKESRTREAEAVALEFDPKIKRSEGAGYRETLNSVWLANTKGLFRHYRRSNLDVSVSVVAEEAEEKQVGESQVQVPRWNDLPSAQDLGRRSGEKAVRLLGGRPVETGRYPVVFDPDAGWTLLVYIVNALRGDHLSRKRSWLTDRPEAKIASDLVSVRDNGRMIGGPSSLPFDGEGVDTRDTLLLDRGVVRGNLCDLEAASRMGVRSTGSSRRGGYEQLPQIGSSNLYLEAGESNPEQILSSVDRGLWIWGLSGWWIGLDPSNPQFSSAASGLWIENGKPTRSVARVTVAGGIEEVLSGIDMVGDDLVHDAPTKAPTFRVGAMSISGT